MKQKNHKSKIRLLISCIIFLMLFFVNIIPAKALTSEDYEWEQVVGNPPACEYGTTTRSGIKYKDGKIYVKIVTGTRSTNTSGYDHVWMKNSAGTELHTRWVIDRSNHTVGQNYITGTYTSSYGGTTYTMYRRDLDWVDIGGAKPQDPSISFLYSNGKYTCDFSATAGTTINVYHDYEWSSGSTTEFVPGEGMQSGVTDYIVAFYYKIDKSSNTSVSTSTGIKTTNTSVDVTSYLTGTDAGDYYIHMIAKSYTGKVSNVVHLQIANDSLKKTVTLNANTGISAVTGAGKYYPGQTVTIGATASTGYTFSNWTNSSNNEHSISASNSFTMPNDNVTLYANAKANTYKLTFNVNGGIYKNPGTNLYNGTNTNSVTVTYNSTNYYRMANDIPTRTGYTFAGWYTASSGGTQVYNSSGVCTKDGTYFNSDNKWVYTGNKTLYAHWTPNIYTITLDNQSATTAGTTAYYEKYNTGNYTTNACTTTISTITKPTKTGYTFGGYYTGTNGSGTQYVNANGNIKSTSTTFTANTTLYAKWTPNTYTLTIDPNGGRIYNGDSTTTSSFNVKFQYDSGRGLGYLTSKGYYGYDNTFGKAYKRSGEIHFFFYCS